MKTAVVDKVAYGTTLPGHCPSGCGDLYDSQAPLTEGLGVLRSPLAKAAPNNPVELTTAHSVGFLSCSWRFTCGPQLTGSVSATITLLDPGQPLVKTLDSEYCS